MKPGVYFVLYLAVILEVLIFILDRDEAEDALRRDIEEFAQDYLKPMPDEVAPLTTLAPVTVQNGMVKSDSSFEQSLRIRGLRGDTSGVWPERSRVDFCRPEEKGQLSLGYLMKLDSLRKFKPAAGPAPLWNFVIENKAPDKGDSQMVVVPGTINPGGAKFGAYKYTLRVHSERLAFVRSNGSVEPDSARIGGKTFSMGLVSRHAGASDTNEIKRKYNEATYTVYVAMGEKATKLPPFKIRVTSPGGWAMENELVLPILVEGRDASKIAIRSTILQGQTLYNSADSCWYWRGTMPYRAEAYSYQVTLQAQDDMGLGSESLANTSFQVRAVLPKLHNPMGFPSVICENESFTVNALVDSLDYSGNYRLECSVGGVEQPAELSPTATFPLARAAEGTQVRIRVLYKNKLGEHRLVNYFNGQQIAPMEFVHTVRKQPAQIVGCAAWPKKVRVGSTLPFWAFRCCNCDNQGAQTAIGGHPKVVIRDGVSPQDLTALFDPKIAWVGGSRYDIRLGTPSIGQSYKVKVIVSFALADGTKDMSCDLEIIPTPTTE